MYGKKIADYKFKLLNNILRFEIFLRKIKKTESGMCEILWKMRSTYTGNSFKDCQIRHEMKTNAY